VRTIRISSGAPLGTTRELDVQRPGRPVSLNGGSKRASLTGWTSTIPTGSVERRRAPERLPCPFRPAARSRAASGKDDTGQGRQPHTRPEIGRAEVRPAPRWCGSATAAASNNRHQHSVVLKWRGNHCQTPDDNRSLDGKRSEKDGFVIDIWPTLDRSDHSISTPRVATFVTGGRHHCAKPPRPGREGGPSRSKAGPVRVFPHSPEVHLPGRQRALARRTSSRWLRTRRCRVNGDRRDDVFLTRRPHHGLRRGGPVPPGSVDRRAMEKEVCGEPSLTERLETYPLLAATEVGGGPRAVGTSSSPSQTFVARFARRTVHLFAPHLGAPRRRMTARRRCVDAGGPPGSGKKNEASAGRRLATLSNSSARKKQARPTVHWPLRARARRRQHRSLEVELDEGPPRPEETVFPDPPPRASESTTTRPSSNR